MFTQHLRGVPLMPTISLQVLELQQQLCEAEDVTESLRSTNSTLRGANRDLASKLEVLRANNSNETHETMWRQSQVRTSYSRVVVQSSGRLAVMMP